MGHCKTEKSVNATELAQNFTLVGYNGTDWVLYNATGAVVSVVNTTWKPEWDEDYPEGKWTGNGKDPYAQQFPEGWDQWDPAWGPGSEEWDEALDRKGKPECKMEWKEEDEKLYGLISSVCTMLVAIIWSIILQYLSNMDMDWDFEYDLQYLMQGAEPESPMSSQRRLMTSMVTSWESPLPMSPQPIKVSSSGRILAPAATT